MAKVINVRPPYPAPFSSSPCTCISTPLSNHGRARPRIHQIGHPHGEDQPENILYGSCSGDYLCFHLASGCKILTLENLGDFVDRLPEESFCLSHRSHFVSLKAIDFGERWRVVIGKT
jgi:hypothetical protein